MNIDPMKTIKKIEKLLSASTPNNLSKLKKVYEQTLYLRSQLLSIMYDIERFGINNKGETLSDGFYEGKVENSVVTITINEPLPALKEFTAIVEEHWIELIHKSIEEAHKENLPFFEKAFVIIEITTPKGSKNSKLWDTSNRAINVIINNLKGIFFSDDNLEHMAFSVVGKWGEKGQTTIKICDFDRLKSILETM